MPRKKSTILPLLVGGILLAQRGCVCQIIIPEENDASSHRMDSAPAEGSNDYHYSKSGQQQSESQTMKEPLPHHHKDIREARFEPPPNGEANTLEHDEEVHDETSHIHTDFIHQVIVDDEENIQAQGSHHYDPEKRANTERPRDAMQSPHKEEEEETSVPTFTVEQLRTLLQTLEGEQKVEHPGENNNRSWKSSDLVDDDEVPKVMEDDRTLLDIFGEAAKQFLTQKVIPETNPECKWDWRSLNCEPMCECEFHFQVGDYHLGRSCRVRTQKPDGICQSVDPAFLVEQTTLSQRIGWMMRRTWLGIRRRYGRGVKNGLEGLKEHSLVQLNELQHNVCSDLWELMYNKERTKSCWSMTDVPSVSITQRILCGPIHFPLCDDFVADASYTQSRTEYA